MTKGLQFAFLCWARHEFRDAAATPGLITGLYAQVIWDEFMGLQKR